MQKVFETHLHYTYKVPVRESAELFNKAFKLYNVEKAVFLSFPSDGQAKEYDRTQNLKGLYLKSVFGENGYAYAGLEHKFLGEDKDSEDFLSQIKEYDAAGFDGIKMYEGHPHMWKLTGYSFADNVYEKFFSCAEEKGIPITMHLANDHSFWNEKEISYYWRYVRNCFFDESFPSLEILYSALFELMDRHPRLKLTLAHCGFMSDSVERMERFLEYKNARIDVTPGGNQLINMALGREEWVPFIEKFADKIKYGSDTYNYYYKNREEWENLVMLRNDLIKNFFLTDAEHEYQNKKYVGINLKREYADKIFFTNAEAELGKPKIINYDYAEAKAKELKVLFAEGSLDNYDMTCLADYFAESKKNI